jgi:hypothetical protein
LLPIVAKSTSIGGGRRLLKQSELFRLDVLPVPLDALPVLLDVLPLDAPPVLPDVPPLDVLPLRHDPPPFRACLAA